MKTRLPWLNRGLAGGLVLVLPECLCAQVASASAGIPAAEPVVVLSPFEVSSERDVGYVASASLSGGRLNTPIAETAGSVSVITKELLDDIGSYNQQDAVMWSTSATTANSYIDSPGPYGDSAVTFRSVASGYNTRNYFRWYSNTDSFMTERFDMSRGPNSLVFGDSGLGGGINITPKRARPQAGGEIQARWQDWGGYRAAVDLNQALGRKFEFRAVYARNELPQWMDRTETNLANLLLTCNWRPMRNTTVTVDYEFYHQIRALAQRPQDNFSRWDGVTGVAVPLATGSFPASSGLGRQATDRFVYVPAAPELGVQNWRNWATSGGTGVRLGPTPFSPGAPTIPSYAYNFGANNSLSRSLVRTEGLILTHRFSDRFFFESGVNYLDTRRNASNAMYTAGTNIDPNVLLPDGRRNPYYGQKFVDNVVTPQLQNHEQWEYRASLAYLESFSAADLRFLVAAGKRDDDYRIFAKRYVLTGTGNPDVTAAVNQINVRRYESHLDQPIDFPGNTKYSPQTASSQLTHKRWQSGQIAMMGSWLKERRLKTLVGYRREAITNARGDVLADPITREFVGFGPEYRTMDFTVGNTTASALYQLNRWLGAYASYAESFDFANSVTSLTRVDIPPLVSKGREYGLRFNFLDGRIHGAACYYWSEQVNNRVGGYGSQINTIWREINGTVETVPNGYSDTSSFGGSGWEFEVVANPTNRLRLTANLSLPKAEQIGGLFETLAYFEANRANWQQAIDNPATSSTSRTLIQQNMDAILNGIQSQYPGRRTNGSYDYSANLWSTYGRGSGIWRGLRCGGGVNFRGPRMVGSYTGRPYEYLFTDAYYTLSAMVSYETRVFGRSLRIQGNVSNLLDERAFQPVSGGYANVTFNGVTSFVAVNNYVIAPRMYSCTLTHRF